MLLLVSINMGVYININSLNQTFVSSSDFSEFHNYPENRF